MVNTDSTVKVHYTGKLNNGEVFDSSYERKEPIEVKLGQKQLIEGFEEALMGMKKGEKKTVTIPCEKAYGQPQKEAIREVPKDKFNEPDKVVEGMPVQVATMSGQPLQAIVVQKNEESFTLDMNHPFAGEDLTFDLEVLEIN